MLSAEGQVNKELPIYLRLCYWMKRIIASTLDWVLISVTAIKPLGTCKWGNWYRTGYKTGYCLTLRNLKKPGGDQKHKLVVQMLLLPLLCFFSPDFTRWNLLSYWKVEHLWLSNLKLDSSVSLVFIVTFISFISVHKLKISSFADLSITKISNLSIFNWYVDCNFSVSLMRSILYYTSTLYNILYVT